MTLGLFLKDKRIAANLTQQNLADAIHVDRSLISRIESDDFVPQKEMLSNICFALNIDYNEANSYILLEYKQKQKKVNILLILTIAICILCVLSLTIPFLRYAGYESPRNQTHHLVYASLVSISLSIHQPLPLISVILTSIYTAALVSYFFIKKKTAKFNRAFVLAGLILFVFYILSLLFSIHWFYRFFL